MAQETSDLWKTLWRTRGTERQYKFFINGKEYGADAETNHSVESGLYETFSIGNAATAKLSLSLFAKNIPRGATIKRFVRLKNGSLVSEWIPKGVFFANTRMVEDGLWTIEAFDVMRKAEAIWTPRQNLVFPLPMADAVTEFAKLMGCEVDPRTTINAAYTIDYPDSETSIRTELQYIAAAHGGNWIATDEGKLLLVPLLSMPAETYYLVGEFGDAITFGGVRILV